MHCLILTVKYLYGNFDLIKNSDNIKKNYEPVYLYHNNCSTKCIN